MLRRIFEGTSAERELDALEAARQARTDAAEGEADAAGDGETPVPDQGSDDGAGDGAGPDNAEPDEVEADEAESDDAPEDREPPQGEEP